MRTEWSSRWWKISGSVLVVAVIAASVVFALSVGRAKANPVSGAAFTTINASVDGANTCLNGNGTTNCNIYTDKNYVWLTGGPSSAALADGTYFFAVLDPGGQNNPNDGTTGNLSSPNDAYTNRTFTISGGAISYVGTHDFNNNLIRLMTYNDTLNPGGVYILAICSLGSGYPVMASACKYDAFKVQSGATVNYGDALTATKDAAGAYTNTYTWGIQKSVDKTLVKQVGGTVTFNYTVTVTHDAGTISGVGVSGTIDVFNPNVDSSSNTVPVDISGVTDQLSDGTVCSVTNGGAQTLTIAHTTFAYSCSLSSVPQGQLDNTVTVSWVDQFLSNGATLNAGTASFTFTGITFTPTLVDNCVTVTDTFNGTQTTLGSPCAGATNPMVYTYSHTLPVPQYNCVTYNNMAAFTTNTTGATGSASQSVQVCGPAHTGALTMGFWQNKNGQYIITHTASTSGVCNLTTWLRQYAPYQDLSATASCAQAATYIYNIIKAANASGASMNAMLKAQMLATALDVYYSDPTLGGNQIGAYNGLGSSQHPVGGFAIDLTQVCMMVDSTGGSASCNGSYENVSAAFGGASNLSISQMISYAASQSNAGGVTWYANVKTTQGLAKDAFDAINNQVAFGV